ncbi:hypothetical protein ACHQM5_004375 [Ranunculus cassubicifolius]
MKTTTLTKQKKNPTSKRPRKVGLEADSFFIYDSKKRRKDDEIESDDSDNDNDEQSAKFGKGNELEYDSEFDEETVGEKKLRYEKKLVENARKQAAKLMEDESESEGEDDEEERERKVDSLAAKMLQKKQMEDSGRAKILIASRVQKPETTDGFRFLVKHRQSVTAVALSEDDMKGFSASKDGTIIQWDVERGKSEKYVWPTKEVMSSHGAKNPPNPSIKWSKHVLDIAASTDGRYLATGGLDRHVHLWDARTRQHIRAFPGHKHPVSCVTFRQGTSELFSGSFKTIKMWNAEDRCFITEYKGHFNEILTIDCLRKERLVTAGRDRTLRFWKVPEESHLILRSSNSLESACFISNDEFLSGSDDGSLELWNPIRKKPVFIVKNAHHLNPNIDMIAHGEDGTENGDVGPNNNYCSTAQSWVGAVAACRNSDLVASGAGNGLVRLWKIDSDKRQIEPLFGLPLGGYVNSLAFAKSGKFLVAGVGQEPRLGRWDRIASTRNGVLVQPLKIVK